MALRDRQVSGISLTKTQSEWLSHFFTACVPVLGYTVWYPLLGIPEELWKFFALIGVVVHLGMSFGVVNPGYERAQLFNGHYTGVSFPAGIYFNPVLPFPLLLLVIRIISEEFYRKFLWSMEGDVRVESIRAAGQAEGLTRDGLRVRIDWMMVLEIENVAVFRSQTRDDTDRQGVIDIIISEYAAAVKSAVISQHTAQELMQGTHSGGSQGLNEWMTEAWNLVRDFGVVLARSPVGAVKILSERMEKAFDVDAGKILLRDVTNEYAVAFAEFKKELPPGTSEEVAFLMFNAARLDEGKEPATINVVKFK